MNFPNEFTVPDGRSVHHVLMQSMQAAGFDCGETDSAAPNFGIPAARRVCFILVDGLGALNFEARSGHGRTLRSFTSLGSLTSVVPSTTAAAVTSIGTAELPGRTAMLGYSLRSPKSGKAFSLIQWDDVALKPHEWQRVPTLFERLGEQAELCRAVQPASHIDSGLTLCALRGVRSVPADSVEDRIEAVWRAFRQGARCVYLYWGDLDKRGHHEGWTSQAWIEALEELDSAIARLRRGVDSDTLFVVSADHGMIDVEERIDMDDIPALYEDVELTAGEERAVQIYTDKAEQVRERWSDILGDQAFVLTAEEVIQAGLLGDTGMRERDMMGDVWAFMRGHVSLLDSRNRLNPHLRLQRGMHGSLTDEEMLIPLLVDVL